MQKKKWFKLILIFHTWKTTWNILISEIKSIFYTYSKDDEAQIIQHAKKQQNTSGTTTQVYYFSELPAGIGNKITLSNSFFDAMDFCLDLDWKYEFSIYPNGKENFRKNE